MIKRVLLDEGVPRHLAGPLQAAGFSATPLPQAWKQATNGELLQLAERHGFDVLITSDKNIYAQQNLRGRELSIILSLSCLQISAGRSWNGRPMSSIRSTGSNRGNMSSS